MFIIPFLLDAFFAVLAGFTTITFDPHGVSFHVIPSIGARTRIQELEQRVQELEANITTTMGVLEERENQIQALQANVTVKKSELRECEQRVQDAKDSKRFNLFVIFPTLLAVLGALKVR